MLGFGLFTLADYALFPNINEYSAELKKTYEEFLVYSYPDIMQNGYGFIILKKLGEMFLYGLRSSCDYVYRFHQEQISCAVHTIFYKICSQSNLHKAAIAGSFRLQ